MTRCSTPRPTRQVASPLGQALAFCTGCRRWVEAAQVRWGQELRDQDGRIVASYAPVAH